MKSNYLNILKTVILTAAALAVVIITLGVLAIPVVMEVAYSYYWLFLYAAYMLIAVYVVLCIEKTGGCSK